MGLHEYHFSRKLESQNPPFYALIMAAMRKADTDNAALLRAAFPETFKELQARYDAPLGAIESDNVQDMEALQRSIAEFMQQK